MSETAADYLRSSAVALSARQAPPSLQAAESALEGYAAELTALRREGATRELSDEALERIFALGFALDQLRLHLRDLARCVSEFATARSLAPSKLAANSAAGGTR